jgi:tetratricopeptide (TPR) repeat protein
LWELWRQERDPVWQADLMAVTRPWHLRLTHVAQHLGGLDKAMQLIHEEYGIPTEAIQEQMDKMLRDVQADSTRLGITDPSELSGMTFLRVKGDAKFSARNRMIQFAQARSEGDFETAILHVRRAVELQPDNAEYHFHLGANLGMVGEIEEGIQECWLAAQLAPTWELPRVEVGIILLNAERSQEACEHLESIACGQDAPSAHLAFNLGARLRSGDANGALDVLEKAIAVVPDHALALDIAAQCAFLVGDLSKGQRLAKLADQHGQSETYREWKDGKYRTTKRQTT